jgi:hypothetical protein
MYKLAEELLDPHDVAAQTVDVLDNQTTVTRTLTLLGVDPSWGYGEGKGPMDSLWSHAGTFLRVEYLKRRRGEVVERDVRLFVTSARHERLTPAQWLLLVRSHWGVENNNHHTLDTAFAEDDRPWIEADEHGMLAVLLLRRIAYTLLALYRGGDAPLGRGPRHLLEDAAPVGARPVHCCHRRPAHWPTPARGRRDTLKSPGSYPRRTTSKGLGKRCSATGAGRPWPPRAPTSDRDHPPATPGGRPNLVYRLADRSCRACESWREKSDAGGSLRPRRAHPSGKGRHEVRQLGAQPVASVLPGRAAL